MRSASCSCAWVALLVSAWTGGCSSAEREARGLPDLVLSNVTVINGLGGAPVSRQTIEIRDGIITAVRPSGPGDSQALDVAGHYVTPGLIDSHVHLPTDEGPLRTHLDSLLRVGITSVRDMACCADLHGRIRAGADSTQVPRVFSSAFWADPVFFANDPRVMGVPGTGSLPWFLAVTDSTDLESAVRNAKNSGASGIKIYSNLSAEVIRDIATEAHRQSMRVWSHPVVFPTRPSTVVSSGIDVISHAALLVWEGVEQIPERYNAVEPFNPFGPPAPYSTVSPDQPAVVGVLEAIRDRRIILDATVSTIAGAVSDEASEWAIQVTRLAHRMGIALVAGTDHPTAGHVALFGELEMLVEVVGLTPLEALTAATSTGAEALGVGDRLGTVQQGKVADLVVYSSDPTVDIINLRHPIYVIRGGRLVRSPSQP